MKGFRIVSVSFASDEMRKVGVAEVNRETWARVKSEHESECVNCGAMIISGGKNYVPAANESKNHGLHVCVPCVENRTETA